MRSVRVDVTGTTDANGNATVRVPLDNTGEFQVLKFALGLPSSAEWSVTATGTVLTFGRGRRVTLGPELIKPQDVQGLTVSVAGGPPNAAILGSATGLAGNEGEMLLAWALAPNTITVDIGAPRRLLGTIAPGPNATLTNNFVLPVGTLAIAFQANSNPNAPNNVTIVGHTTGDTYWNASLGPLGIIRKRSIDPAIDPSVDCSVTAAVALGASVDFWAVMAPEAIYVQNDNQDPLNIQVPAGSTFGPVDVSDRAARLLGVVNSITNTVTVQEGASPPLWQAPNQPPVTVDANIGAGGSITILSGASGQRIRLFGFALTSSAAPIQVLAGSTEIGSIASGATWATNFGGAVIDPATFVSLNLKAPGGATSVNGMVSYSIG